MDKYTPHVFNTRLFSTVKLLATKLPRLLWCQQSGGASNCDVYFLIRHRTLETTELSPMASEIEIDHWEFTEELPRENLKLSDQILDKYVKSKFDHEVKQFLPGGCIDELVTLEAIIKEIVEKDQLKPGDLDLQEGSAKKKVIDFIREKAKKVFAITVVSGLRGRDLGMAMFQFMGINFIDNSLPVKEGNLSCFHCPASPWSRVRIHNFCREQWRFLAPIFSQQNFKVDLEPEHILPFIEKDNLVKEGAFGQVFPVEIHPAHQKDPVLNVRPLSVLCHCLPK